MAFKVKLKDFNSPNFMGALRVLCNEKLPVKVSWNINRIEKQLFKEIQNGREQYIKLLKEHSELTPDGDFVHSKGEDGKDILDTNIFLKNETGESLEGAFKEKFEGFLNEEVEIKSFKIKLDEIEKVNIEPSVLAELTSIITEGEED